MPKKAKPVLPSWYVSKLKKEAVMPKKPAHKAVKTAGKDVNYTVPGLLALFGIVLVTALYFSPNIAEKAAGNIAGSAIEPGQDITAPSSCEIQSRCEGSKLVRQQPDCKIYEAYCQYGCELRVDGAICR